MKSAQSSRVKSGRLGRLGQMGRLATGLAGGVVSEGARQFAQGKRPQWRELMLTPGNLGRVADQLAQLRGAAMKVGQLLSMDAGQLLPPELSGLLDRLRSEGYAMPTRQLRQVLAREWGGKTGRLGSMILIFVPLRQPPSVRYTRPSPMTVAGWR